MATVSTKSLSKRYGATVALDSVSIEFPEGGLYGLLGPSGSGKTTLLRCIAGFVEPDSGSVSIGGAPVEDVPVNKRNIGMMFQSYALFPHMGVFDNVAFGLSVRNIDRTEITTRVGDILELVQLTGLERRRPGQLSGGQQQRVALARALVTRPRVLLLDEPLAALDKQLRQDMQIELKRIQREIGITTIFVTHDQEEALTLSDHIAILSEGRIVQDGPPRAMYESPNSAFAATFLGAANIFKGRSADGVIACPGFPPIRTHMPLPANGQEIQIAVRPEKIAIHPATATIPEGQNAVDGTVRDAVFTGSSMTYRVTVADAVVTAFAQNSDAVTFSAGTEVKLIWSPDHTVVLKE